MKDRIRSCLAAMTLVLASFVVATGASPSASGAVEPATMARGDNPGPLEADVRAKLPAQGDWDIVVDDTHQRVFVGGDPIMITDFSGKVARTIAGNFSGDMTLAEDGSAVYVFRWGSPDVLVRIDTTTYVITSTPMPTGVYPYGLTFTGGKVWFSYSSGGSAGLGAFDPQTRQLQTGMITTPKVAWHLRALPDHPNRLALVGNTRFLGIYDVSSGTPEVVAQNSELPSQRSCLDAALAGGGDLLVTACQELEEHPTFHTDDLSTAPAIPSGSSASAVAATADGRYVAAGVSRTSGPRIYVTDIRDGTPGTFGRSYTFADGSSLGFNQLAFGADGRLFAVEHASDGTYLNVFMEATKHLTKVTLSVPEAVEYRDAVDAAGKLSYGPGVPTAATLTAKDRAGTRALGTIPIDGDGRFEFRDQPRVTGPVTYTVAFPGDATHPPASGQATTIRRPLPYDVNADGYAETVVGSPSEDIGSVKDAGSFHLLYGSSSGLKTSGSRAFDQNSTGVPGTAEAGDRFGFANASGDFDGDGYADVAVSAPYEGTSSGPDEGIVCVFFGSGSGLRTDNVRLFTLSISADRDHAQFGYALTAGDFDGDGRDDLAMGAPGADVGHAVVWRGTPPEWGTRRFVASQQGVVPGTAQVGERFGGALAAGDVNGDGYDELAVGASHDRDDLGRATGSVTIFDGTPTWLTSYSAHRWSKEMPGVPGDAGSDSDSELSDQFGDQVALADYNGDGMDDLTVGAPGAPVIGIDGVRKPDAGTVTVLPSSEGNISTAGAVEVTQSTGNMPGVPGSADRFGATVATGDTNGDGMADLAIYSPGDTYVTVVPGTSGGAGFSSAKGWTQNTTGIPGSSETGDRWGNSLRFADVEGTGNAALIVGADGENNGAGACTVVYGTTTGLTATGSVYLSQDTTGVPGTAEPGDGFGTFF